MSSNTVSNVNLNKISSKDLCSVLNIIILNKYVSSGATEICYQLFRRLFSSYLKRSHEILNSDITVQQLNEYTHQLIFEKKFSKQLFCELLFNEIKDTANIPLELIVWLDENNVYTFAQYCMIKSTEDISSQITNLIESSLNRELSYIFIKILIAAYNSGITTSAKLFTIKCRKILDDFVNLSLIEFEKEDPKLINILPIELDSVLYGQLIQQFKKQILQKVLTHKNRANLQDAFMMHEIWTLKNFSEQFLIVYYELIKSYTLEEIFEIINNIPEEKLNWRFVLIFISVFVKNNSKGFKQIIDFVNRKLQILFSDQMKYLPKDDLKPSSELLSCIIFVRHVCYEQDNSQLTYCKWYSITFGPDTNLRTGTDPAAFNLFLTTLTSVVNKEPIHFLRSHIERSIRTPSGSQSDMLVFKDVCRLQLSRIIQSEQINIKNVNIPVITLLEEGLNRFDCIWALKQSYISKKILPYIINDSKYERLKEMILFNGSVNQNDVLSCKKLSVMKNEINNVESDSEILLFE